MWVSKVRAQEVAPTVVPLLLKVLFLTASLSTGHLPALLLKESITSDTQHSLFQGPFLGLGIAIALSQGAFFLPPSTGVVHVDDELPALPLILLNEVF